MRQKPPDAEQHYAAYMARLKSSRYAQYLAMRPSLRPNKKTQEQHA